MVRIKSSQKIFTEDEVSSLTGHLLGPPPRPRAKQAFGDCGPGG